MDISEIFIGGWFQRTTLHLTEVYDFLSEAKSDLDFPIDVLAKKRESLAIEKLERINWLLEYLEVKSQKLDWRIYEDGLIVLNKKFGGSLKDDFFDLENYYDKMLSPAITYLFSKGAPVPKELANIKTLLPFIVVGKKGRKEEVEKLFSDFGEKIYSQTEETDTSIYKGAKMIVIISAKKDLETRSLVESQIFFREFKTQLHKYLNIHRHVWEEIAAIKEKGVIKGREVGMERAKLNQYQKTIELISSRIDQMSTYLKTRAKISVTNDLDQILDKTFMYKFETLENTLNYVRDLWKMTEKYLASADKLFTDIQAQSTKTAISSLQLITTIVVVAGIVGYLGRDSLPGVTPEGFLFFNLLVVITWLANKLVNKFYSEKDYIITNKREGINV